MLFQAKVGAKVVSMVAMRVMSCLPCCAVSVGKAGRIMSGGPARLSWAQLRQNRLGMVL